jgi:hypothetical protein
MEPDMQELRHPLTEGLYGLDPETGLVRVEEHGHVGWFDFRGEWRSGDKFHPDPEMCNWVGGPGADGAYDRPFKSI